MKKKPAKVRVLNLRLPKDVDKVLRNAAKLAELSYDQVVNAIIAVAIVRQKPDAKAKPK